MLFVLDLTVPKRDSLRTDHITVDYVRSVVFMRGSIAHNSCERGVWLSGCPSACYHMLLLSQNQ